MAATAKEYEQELAARARAWWLVVALVTVTTLAWTTYPSLAGWHGKLFIWCALVALFGIFEATQVRVEIRRQTWIFGVGEVPLVLGLFLVQPGALLLARLAAAAPRYVMQRRSSVEKKAFNLALFSLEVAVACVVFNAFADNRDLAQPINWVAALVAMLALDMVGALCLYTVISLTQGRLTRQQALLAFAPNLAMAPFNTGIALIVLLAASVDLRALIPVGGMFVAVVMGYRAYARVLRQHAALGQVYRFSQFLDEIRGRGDSSNAALDQLRELLNATAGLIRIEFADDQPFVIWSAEQPVMTRWLPPQATDPIVRRCLDGSSAILVGTKTDCEIERLALEARGVSEVLAVPLRLGERIRGHVELWDRRSQQATFTDDDARFLENLAKHLAAAIENEQLVVQLRHDANHDRLTGLPNREHFTHAVDLAIDAATVSDRLAAVLLMDLDSFKDVNDALGHDHGDKLLVMVSQRLRECAAGSESTVVARMGADEFAILCPVDDLGVALRRAQAVRAALVKPYPLAGLTVEVGVSIGVAVAPEHAQNGGMLMQRADVALYHAKNTGRRITSYLPSMDQASVHRLQLVTQLREAIHDGQVQVRYQPKIALESKDLIGVEALVRWLHPDYGQVMPDEFVPLAERTGLIEPLTTYVLRTALSQCRSWLDRDMRIGVAVNLSVRSLLDTAFPDLVEDLLTVAGVPPDLLTFEITENNVMTDRDRSLPVLNRLHQIGIGLSIDDFGTGYSSLAYLRKLPVDEVKIDKDFVLTMGTDLGDLAIVRAIVELGRSLSLRVVAEGVEDELARDLLSGMGCDVIQGFLVSRALTADRLDAWLNARTSLRPHQAGLLGRRPQLTG